MPKSERQAKRKIRIVGGGYRFNRTTNGVPGGSMRAKRRAERKRLKKAKRGKS